MKCLFVPDNILTIICEEQSLFQSLLDFQFYETIPYCPIESEIEIKNFAYIELEEPENKKDIIIRKCFMMNVDEKKIHLGNFILGVANQQADLILQQKESLKLKSRNKKSFEVLKCKVCYTSDFEITKMNNLTEWEIKDIKWKK